MRKLKLGVTSKLTLVFVLFAAALLAGVGLLSYYNGRAALEAATVSELLATAIEKEAALSAWVEDRRADVASFAASPGLLEDVAALLGPDGATAHERLVAELHPHVAPDGAYLEFSVIQPETGEVFASTNPAEEGEFKEDRPYFLNGRRDPYVQSVYYSTATQRPAMMAAAPLRSADGRLLGVLAARLNLEQVNAIVQRRTGLHQSDDAFLVNTSSLFVTQPRLVSDPAVLQRDIQTAAVQRCLAGSSGTITAPDYRGIPTLIVYRWLPERQLCLIVKVDQAEAIAPAHAFGRAVALIGGLALLTASVLAFALARTITGPVKQLMVGARELGSGKLDTRIDVKTGDELEQLAGAFARMAEDLQKTLVSRDELLKEIAERKQAEEALRESEHLLRMVMDLVPHFIFAKDYQSRHIFANRACAEANGMTPEQMVGLCDLDFVPDLVQAEAFMRDDREVIASGRSKFVPEERLTDAAGRTRILQTTKVPFTAPGTGEPTLMGVAVDITEIKQAEARLRKLNRVYAVLSEINQAIVRTREPQVLFEQVCRIAVEMGGFRMAWIGLVGEASQQVQVVAQAGGTDAYFEQAGVTSRGEPVDYCPIQNTLRDRQRAICNMIGSAAPCQEIAFQLGARSAAAFPLLVSGRMRGTLNFYAGETDFFDEEEIKLLDDLALDISFAIEFAEKEAERKRAEAALQEAEARYRALVEQIPAIVYTDSAEQTGQTLYISPQIKTIAGYDPQEWIADNDLWLKIMLPDDHEGVSAEYTRANENREPFRAEYRIATRDGRIVWLRDQAALVRDPAGRPLFWQGIILDITDRKRAEEEIRQLNAELEQRVAERTAELSDLYNNAPCGYHSLDGDSVFVHINDTELDWLGYTREEVIGKMKAPDLLTPASVEAFGKNFPVFMERGWLRNLELDMVRKDGSILPILLSATAVTDQDGRYLMSRSTMIDHTDRKRAEAALRESQAKLETANQELEAFAYSVSHDLRAPLRGIDGWSLALLEDYYEQLDDQARQYLDRVRSEAQRMGRLIDDLLQLSRVTRAEMRKGRVDLTALARTVAARLKATQPERQVELVIQPGLTAHGDAHLLEIVLTNLLGNAWKFTGPCPLARIEFGRLLPSPCEAPPIGGKGRGAGGEGPSPTGKGTAGEGPSPTGRGEGGEGPVYFIRDNGVGFDMTYAQKLFGAFQRLHKASEFPGTGIGLATVQRIVHRHGGRVWAEAQADRGATFYFTLGETT
jgi:PAS domain S-box-containing protein